MKKLLFVLLCFITAFTGYGQKYLIAADTTLLYSGKPQGNELILRNSTRDILGFLYNSGNGITTFKHGLIQLNDSTYLIGSDTLKISSAFIDKSEFLQKNNNLSDVSDFSTSAANILQPLSGNAGYVLKSTGTGVQWTSIGKPNGEILFGSVGGTASFPTSNSLFTYNSTMRTFNVGFTSCIGCGTRINTTTSITKIGDVDHVSTLSPLITFDNATGITVEGKLLSPLKYADDYHNLFTDFSLVDKIYVDNIISMNSGINGLHSVHSAYGLNNVDDSTLKIDSAMLSNYYVRRKDSSVNSGYYPYNSNPKNYQIAQYDFCGNLIQTNLSNVLKAGSFLDNDYTIDMSDHEFTIGGRGVFIIDGDKFYVNNIEASAETDSIWALNKNNKVVKIPNGGQYWQTINSGTTLSNKGSSLLNIKFTLPFTVDSITTNYLLQLGAPGFVPVSLNSLNNNIKLYSDAGYLAWKLNKSAVDTFYRKLTGTFTNDHFANLQDKNGTLAYWGDNLSLFTNDINFDGSYFKKTNLLNEITGGTDKATARTNIGALTSTLADGKFFVGDGSNVATGVSPTGDVTFNNTGVFTIGSAKVTNAMLAGSINDSKLSSVYLLKDASRTVTAKLDYSTNVGSSFTSRSMIDKGYVDSVDALKQAALTFSTGLTGTTTITNDLITGKVASSQTVTGSTSASGSLILKSTTDATKGYVGVTNAPATTANYGSFVIGSGAFDGSTSGFFAGSANGTQLAINSVSGYTGNMIHVAKAGTTVMKVDNAGLISAATWNGVKIGLAYGGTNNDLSATGGTSQVLKQSSVGANVTVETLASTDLSDATTSGTSMFTLVGVSAVRYPKLGTDNLWTLRTAGNFLTDIAAAPLASPSFTGTVTITNGNLALGTAGNKISITEGTNGSVGRTTLVAGTKTITITGVSTSSRAFVTLVAQGGTSTTVYQYAAVCTANTLTISAVSVVGALVNTDTSVINYFIIN